MARRAVFLDRDGVLNRAVVREGRPFPPASLEEMELLPGVEEACRALKAAGAFLACVTNQPDIARRKTTWAVVDAINGHLRQRLGLDDLVVCPHDNADNCACRKPKPGMLIELARRHGLDLGASVMVGDRRGDILAGRAAGCATVFIDYGWNEPRPDAMDVVSGSLAEAVPWILNHFEESAQ